MNIWEFMSEHPILTFFLVLMITDTISRIATSILS